MCETRRPPSENLPDGHILATSSTFRGISGRVTKAHEALYSLTLHSAYLMATATR